MNKSTVRTENISYGLICVLLLWNAYSIMMGGNLLHTEPSKPYLNDIFTYFLLIVIYLSPVFWSFQFKNKLLRRGVFIWYVGVFIDITIGCFYYYINEAIPAYSPMISFASEIINLILGFTALALFVIVRGKGKIF